MLRADLVERPAVRPLQQGPEGLDPVGMCLPADVFGDGVPDRLVVPLDASVRLRIVGVDLGVFPRCFPRRNPATSRHRFPRRPRRGLGSCPDPSCRLLPSCRPRPGPYPPAPSASPSTCSCACRRNRSRQLPPDRQRARLRHHLPTLPSGRRPHADSRPSARHSSGHGRSRSAPGDRQRAPCRAYPSAKAAQSEPIAHPKTKRNPTFPSPPRWKQ